MIHKGLNFTSTYLSFFLWYKTSYPPLLLYCVIKQRWADDNGFPGDHSIGRSFGLDDHGSAPSLVPTASSFAPLVFGVPRRSRIGETRSRPCHVFVLHRSRFALCLEFNVREETCRRIQFKTSSNPCVLVGGQGPFWGLVWPEPTSVIVW